MLFNSLSFLYFFLPVSYFVFHAYHGKSFRYVWMTVCGYVFYSFWNYKFCTLMLFSTLVSYLAGRGLLAWENPRLRKLCLVVPITVDLLLLGFFKYANFTMGAISDAAGWLGVPVHLPALAIILPLGISFYTFHTITYIVDSYRRVITPTRNFFEFSCYVSLFPQLIAGPIVRFRQVEADLENIDQDRGESLRLGWSFFTIGMIKKVLIADTIAAMIDPALQNSQRLSTVDAWLCALGYTYQLYFDFSGYCDMAVGLGYLFGIRLPQNFNSPYKAVDVADFWRRWHISLSTCLRDYLYIPLGGNRGTAWQTHRNLMITMLLGGLWHGANWTFVLWGGYHGALLVAYRLGGRFWDLLPRGVRNLGTMLLVIVGWVLFRSENIGVASSWLRAMFVPSVGTGAGYRSLTTLPWAPSLAVAVAIAAVVAHGLPNSFELRHEWGPVAAVGMGAMFLLCLVVIYGANASPFLYFQF
jgi:alginate O-acetyltransferase complex protein AlgI